MTRLRVIRMGVGLAGILLLSSCATQPSTAGSSSAPGVVQSPIVAPEAAIRSRTFEAGKPIVFDSVISVFEDSGYAIRRADVNTGIITARTTIKSNEQGVASALVEEAGEGVRVILNFAIRTLSSDPYGQVRPGDSAVYQSDPATESYSFSFTTTLPFERDEPKWHEETVTEADVYRNAFAHIEQAIAGRSQ